MKDLLFDRLHTGLNSVLDLRQKQHSLTTSNIANVDTPFFKARSIRFDELLKDAVGNNKDSMKKTDARHFSGLSGTVTEPEIFEHEAAPWVIDGNSVSLEREMVRLKSNSMMFRTVTKGITKRLGMIRFAASNGKG
jgi:flagellar basal-body rod protein FlgB